MSTGDLSTVLATRAETKEEHAPLLSQVSSVMTAKVIDYTLRWADRAERGPLQKSRYGGWPNPRSASHQLFMRMDSQSRWGNQFFLLHLSAIWGLLQHIPRYNVFLKPAADSQSF